MTQIQTDLERLGFAAVEPEPTPQPEPAFIKTLKLHGIEVEIKHETNSTFGHCLTASVARHRIGWPESPAMPELKHLFGDDPKKLYAEAMAWADLAAHSIALMNAAAAATNNVTWVAPADHPEPEYWRQIACDCVDMSGEVDECTYVADITALMTSPEVGPQLGGVCNVTYPDVYDVSVRVELMQAYEAGGKWLALYAVELA